MKMMKKNARPLCWGNIFCYDVLYIYDKPEETPKVKGEMQHMSAHKHLVTTGKSLNSLLMNLLFQAIQAQMAGFIFSSKFLCMCVAWAIMISLLIYF